MTTDEILDILESRFPNAHCELVHQNPFELLVAVVLSAQTTDAVSYTHLAAEIINKVAKGSRLNKTPPKMGPNKVANAFTCTVIPFACISFSSSTNKGMLACTAG